MRSFLPIINLLCTIWVGFFLIELLDPFFTGPSAGGGLAYLASFLYFALVLISAIVCYRSFGNRIHSIQPSPNSHSPRLVYIIVGLTTFFSIMGLLLVGYDLLYIQKIDYSRGLAMARWQWITSSTARESVSSVASVIGNVLVRFYFIGIIMAVFHRERLRILFLIITGIMLLCAIFGLSFLNGGRSELLLMICAALSGCVLRRMYGKRFYPGSKLIFISALLVISFGTLYYVSFIYSTRADIHNTNIVAYTLSLLDYLGGRPADVYYDSYILSELPDYIIYPMMALLVYMIHPLWTFQNLAAATEFPGRILFTRALSYLDRIGLINYEPEEWLYAGKWISLPGAVWYDFGWPGIIVFPLIHGSLLGIGTVLVTRKSVSGLSLGFFTLALTVSLLAPFIAAFELGGFLIVILAFVTLDGVARVISPGRSWLY